MLCLLKNTPFYWKYLSSTENYICNWPTKKIESHQVLSDFSIVGFSP